MAAAREGRRLDLAEILAYCRAAEGDPLLIEGIGGAMVPISERHTVLDWIAELGAPALVVTGSYLGTISHTLTTLAAIRGRGVPIAGLVISESAESPVPLAETAETINRHAGPLPTVLVARLPAWPRSLARGPAARACAGPPGRLRRPSEDALSPHPSGNPGLEGDYIVIRCEERRTDHHGMTCNAYESICASYDMPAYRL